MERVLRTATALRAKLPALLTPEPKLDLPLVYTRWRALLRGLSSLENHRQAFGARIEPGEALGFLLFAADAPRSLRYGAATVKAQLDRLAEGGPLSPASRILGRLHADLAYRDEAPTGPVDPMPLLDHVVAELSRAHDALSIQFFEA